MFAVTSWKQDGLPELHDQPDDTSILDYQRTHFADFSHSHYRSEIPEPGTVSLLGLAALALIGRRRRGSIR